MLVALIGPCVVQIADERPRHLAPGEAIRVPGGVPHWHGALPGGPASHLALNVHGPTEWRRSVSESEYRETIRSVR